IDGVNRVTAVYPGPAFPPVSAARIGECSGKRHAGGWGVTAGLSVIVRVIAQGGYTLRTVGACFCSRESVRMPVLRNFWDAPRRGGAPMDGRWRYNAAGKYWRTRRASCGLAVFPPACRAGWIAPPR
ncbi:MAG TPA: hypothetical protein DEP05_02520, partial [Betaproteobacteria bacterium]|nr:hypothetical protein [Betaproteobacteria bacterium]